MNRRMIFFFNFFFGIFFNLALVNLQLNYAKTFGDERGTWSPNIEMDDDEHRTGLSCGVGSQIKESAHWQCFSLFINQIHRNEHVRLCVWVCACVRVGGDGWVAEGSRKGLRDEAARGLHVVTSWLFFTELTGRARP